ncbi:MAG: hypothetical protein K9I94_05750 [Bacteroidales bacterium]|nr:hypothetical protein [Bacteroidales bacterium]
MERVVLLFFTIVAVLSNTANSQDQKAVEILESMQERYEQSIEDIDDYLMEKGKHTIFYKKAFTEDGKPYFKTKTKGNNKKDMGSASATNKDLYSQFSSKAKEKAIYERTDKVDGHEVHVIYIDQMEIKGFNADRDTEDAVEDIYLYIDSDKLVVRKMKYTITSKIKGGEPRKVSPVVKNKDFRNVEGMLIPYETATVIKGLTLTEEERKKIEKGLSDFEKEMEEMPESQREMMEQMAGDKIERYRKMIEKDQYEQVKRVKNIEVNTGMKLEDF